MGIIYLILGLLAGAVIGWLARGNVAAQEQSVRPVEPPRPRLEELHDSLDRSLDPLTRHISELSEQVRELEQGREAAYTTLAQQIRSLTSSSARLNERSEDLVSALRSPQVRGRWGMVQLERVVELGGMVRHCDFSTSTPAQLDGLLRRPDLVVHLAGQRRILVDARAPFDSYLEAMDASGPEQRAAHLRRHARRLRDHITGLASPEQSGDEAVEFMVAFIPADPFLDAALSVDPELLEFAFERDIVLATPTTLFALLRTVALGWRQEEVVDRARQINLLGTKLHTRLNSLTDDFNAVGRALEQAVETYNDTLDTLDSTVTPTARQLSELQLPARTRPHLSPLQPAHPRPRHARADPTDEEPTP